MSDSQSNRTLAPISNAPPSTQASPQLAPRPFEDAEPEGELVAKGNAPSHYSFSTGAVTAPVQAKLTIGQPGDPYEQEADQMAAQVVEQINAPQTVQRQSLIEQEEELQMKPQLQRQSLEEEEELQMNPQLQKQATGGGTASDDLESSIQTARGQGQPLSDNIRGSMEQAFGVDFSGVKIHTNSHAHQLNEAVQAKAFTTGQNIFFRQGEYQPGSRSGQELLAHELTHVVQQGGSQTKHTQIVASNLHTQSDTAALQRHEVIEFGEEEALHIEVPVETIAGTGSGAGEREVEAEINELQGWVNLYLSAYRDGLNSFSDTMSFSSDEEAQPRYFDVALKEVGKVLLDELIDHATSNMPIVGPVVKGAKSVLTALYEEAERAESAQGEARIREYIVSTRNAISEEGGIHRQLLQIMDNARPALLGQYRNAVSSSAEGAPDDDSRQEMIDSQGSRGHLTGEAATFIRDLKAQVERFKNSVPGASRFQRRFTEAFADTPGSTDYVSHGGLESGSLHLNMKVYRERHGSGSDAYWSYRVEDTDSSWQLATSAPQASRLAQSLMDTLGGSVSNTALPKYLHVRVETEVWGLNEYDRAVIYFQDPSNPDYRGWDANLSRWVWSIPQVQQNALAVTRISEG